MTMIPLLDNLATLGLVVKEDDVDLLGQLRHRGEDEGERGDDHHRHRGERTNLEEKKNNVVLTIERFWRLAIYEALAYVGSLRWGGN